MYHVVIVKFRKKLKPRVFYFDDYEEARKVFWIHFYQIGVESVRHYFCNGLYSRFLCSAKQW